MNTPRSPQITTTNTVYPTPDTIRHRPQKIKALDPTYLPLGDENRASDDEYEWLPTGTALKRPRKSKTVDPTFRPVGDDHRQSDDEYEWLPSGVKRPRKSRTIDPTYCPVYEPGDGDDESMSPTQRRISRKRKRVSGTAGKQVEGQDSPADKGLSVRPPKANNASSGGKARIKTESQSLPLLADITDHAHGHSEQPATPRGQIVNPGNLAIYPTPSSPTCGLSNKRHSSSGSYIVNPKTPIWDSGSSLEPDNEKTDPSWGLPKSRKRSRSIRDGDEIYLPSPKVVKKGFSKRQLLLTGVNDGLSDEDDEYEYIDQRNVSKNEAKGVVYDFSLERAKRWAAAVSLPEDKWSEAEKQLFFRLAMRGFEPLLPRHWQHDFSTLPNTMFPLPDDKTAPIIRAFKHSDFHAIKALAGLFSLGAQVRDCSILRTRPEVKVKRAIKKYIRWAIRDANLHENPETIPVYTICAQKEGESVVSAVTKLNKRLGKLAKRYHDALGVSSLDEQLRFTSSRAQIPGTQNKQELDTDLIITSRSNFPLLVGFVICGPIVAILTLDTDPLSPKGWGEGTGSKFISQFDVGERGQDVWTSLALAITIMHIRKTMMQLADGGKGGFRRSREDGLVGSDEDL